MAENTGILQRKGLSASVLKNLAYVFMIIDHVGYSVIASYYGAHGLNCNNEPVYVCFRLLGRLAFPIFIFLLVEGYNKTGNKLNYLIRLLAFAFISEIPFNLFVSKKIIYSANKNVMFDLAISFAVLWAVDYCSNHSRLNKITGYLLNTVIVVSGIALEIVLGCDYSVIAVALTMVFYFFLYDYKRLFPMVAVCLFGGEFLHFVLGSVISRGINSIQPEYLSKVLSYSYSELVGVISLIFILRYNGQKGHQVNKYVYYLIYPLQFLILYGITRFLFLG